MNNFDNEQTESLLNNDSNTQGVGVTARGKKKKTTKWIILGLSVIAIILLCFIASYFIKRYQYNEKITQGVDLLSNKNYYGAKTALDGAIEIDPNNPEAYELLLDVGVNQSDTDLIDQSTNKLLELGLSSSDISLPSEFPSGSINLTGVNSETLETYSNPETLNTDLDFYEKIIKKGMVSFQKVKSYEESQNCVIKISEPDGDSGEVSVDGESKCEFNKSSNERAVNGTVNVKAAATINGNSENIDGSVDFEETWKGKILTIKFTDNGTGKTDNETLTTKTDPNFFNDLAPLLKASETYIEEESDSYIVYAKISMDDLMTSSLLDDSYYSDTLSLSGDESVVYRMILDKTYCLPVSMYIDISGAYQSILTSILKDGTVDSGYAKADFSNYTFE